jgi:hypothetical protein
MDKFLGRYQVSKLNHVQISNLNNPISPKEMEAEAVINSLPTKKKKKKKSQGTGFSAEFYQIFKEDLSPILLKLLHKIETEGTLPNSLYETTITMIPKPRKDSTKKENFRPISPYKYTCKNTQKNPRKSNPRVHQNDHLA